MSPFLPWRGVYLSNSVVSAMEVPDLVLVGEVVLRVRQILVDLVQGRRDEEGEERVGSRSPILWPKDLCV